MPYRTVLVPAISKYNRRQMVTGRGVAHLKDMVNSGEEIKSRVNSKNGNFSWHTIDRGINSSLLLAHCCSNLLFRHNNVISVDCVLFIDKELMIS